jgi:hypothetical protein
LATATVPARRGGVSAVVGSPAYAPSAAARTSGASSSQLRTSAANLVASAAAADLLTAAAPRARPIRPSRPRSLKAASGECSRPAAAVTGDAARSPPSSAGCRWAGGAAGPVVHSVPGAGHRSAVELAGSTWSRRLCRTGASPVGPASPDVSTVGSPIGARGGHGSAGGATGWFSGLAKSLEGCGSCLPPTVAMTPRPPSSPGSAVEWCVNAPLGRGHPGLVVRATATPPPLALALTAAGRPAGAGGPHPGGRPSGGQPSAPPR